MLTLDVCWKLSRRKRASAFATDLAALERLVREELVRQSEAAKAGTKNLTCSLRWIGHGTRRS